MLSKLIVIQGFILLVHIMNAESQICERKEVITKHVNLSYWGPVSVTYLGSCPTRCIRTRRKVVIKYRTVLNTQESNVKYCCSGYTRKDTSSDDSAIECAPICMPSCKNGYCASPGTCACNNGYVPDPENSHNCLPVCEQNCTNGACVAANVCVCNFGYSLVNDSCQPICTEPCHNGTCVSPETCECHIGYRKSERNICEPYCSRGCVHGACIAPEECSCNHGYRLSESEDLANKVCKPFCSENCTNGICVEPEKCMCLPSYKKSENGVCVPACEPGWILKDKKCVAQCKISCGNGTCTFPNVCVCYPGYRIDFTRLLSSGKIDAALCVPSCTNCNGTCVAPGVCVTKQSLISVCDGCNETQTANTTEENTNSTLDDSDTYTSGYNTYYDDSISSTIIYDDIDNATASSWIADHWIPLFVPIVGIIAAIVLLFLVYRYTPACVFFKGKSYVVKNGPQEKKTKGDESYSFEDVKIRFSNVNKTK
ncbi:fibrillin-1-like [Trichoplusia ni]|uniref:Fibrillin-1-like n=1 Tax=Trichoplusia ni TaxID=7111 RepID=A0A7E5X1A9_TRINI|nr:fibrillin-1-like [Trichoplusia ni]